MKKILYIFIIFIFLVGCKKDEDKPLDTTEYKQQIVGYWVYYQYFYKQEGVIGYLTRTYDTSFNYFQGYTYYSEHGNEYSASARDTAYYYQKPYTIESDSKNFYITQYGVKLKIEIFTQNTEIIMDYYLQDGSKYRYVRKDWVAPIFSPAPD